MDVLLVNPKCTATFWSFEHALRFARGKVTCPPPGLLTIAGMLPEKWNLRLVDMNPGRLRGRDIEKKEYQPRYRRRLTFPEFKGFLKSIFFLGILGNGASQWYYWKMMVKAAIFYRKSFAEAMTLMVYGYHFRRVARRV